MNSRVSKAWLLAPAIVLLSALLVACGQGDMAGNTDMQAEPAMPEPVAEQAAAVDVSVAMPSDTIPVFPTDSIARKGFFYAGGDYVGDPPVMGGQMYVEIWEPREITQQYPIVLFHGNGQTGVIGHYQRQAINAHGADEVDDGEAG